MEKLTQVSTGLYQMINLLGYMGGGIVSFMIKPPMIEGEEKRYIDAHLKYVKEILEAIENIF